MNFNDLYNQRKNGHQGDQNYYGGHRDDLHGNHGGLEQYRYYFEKLKNSKKLLVVLSVVAIVIVIIIITILMMFIPLILKMLGAIQTNGISGIIETAKPLLERLWSGTGK
jgi:hypothetical protein